MALSFILISVYGANQKMLDDGKSTSEVVGDAGNASTVESQGETKASENELALKSVLSDASFTLLKDSETGLHRKSLQELIKMLRNITTTLLFRSWLLTLAR